VLESPLARAKILLHDWRALALIQCLAKPHNLAELCDEFREISLETITLFVRLLLGCQAVVCMGEDGRAEEEHPTLRQWEFHDLLFHSRSRMGRHTYPFGATFRFLETTAPLPAVKPSRTGERMSLSKPDVDTLKSNEVSFTRVLEERRSRRKFGESPLTALQLSEFLYRTARVKDLSSAAYDVYERSSRPYPSGGACYELELYVVVNACAGLSPGLYHYCPQGHQLYRVSGRTRTIDTLLERAYYATDQQSLPQILFILAARFQRVTWKYEAMAYALTLKHVGVLYQTMYLVAEAMGLAACALGGGDSDLFAAAAGTDYYAEPSVGEFILGSRAIE
jgi:SagB-type dehydrogenase family enzyme